MNAISKAIYSGTMIRDLEAAADRLMRHNSIPCECGAVLGQHSHIGRRCPNPNGYWLTRSFKELRCEASIVCGMDHAGYKCNKPVVAGQRLCEEHAQ